MYIHNTNIYVYYTYTGTVLLLPYFITTSRATHSKLVPFPPRLKSYVPQALAKAETVECLKFAVRLWEVKGQVVAEVQRTSGCGFLYQQTAKRILRAAKYGIEEEDNSATKTTKNNPRSLPSCVPRVTPSQWEACTLDELSMAIKALQPGNKYDAHLLAMQSLVQLTEASQCRQYCVNIIFSKDSELLSTILTLVQSTSRLAADDNTATMNDYESGNSLVQEYCTVMHRHALTVLANCLAAVAEEDASVSTTNDVMEDLTSEATLSSLVRAVTQANAAPHAAASACRCLHSLCTLHPAIAPSLAQDFGMTETLVATQQECRHAILQTECAALMRDL